LGGILPGSEQESAFIFQVFTIKDNHDTTCHGAFQHYTSRTCKDNTFLHPFFFSNIALCILPVLTDLVGVLNGRVRFAGLLYSKEANL